MIFILLTYAVLLGSSLFLLNPEILPALVQEHGIIENLSAFCLALSSGLTAIIWTKHKKPLSLALSFLLICACFREMDFHKEFTTMSILKSRFYLSPDVLITEKIIGALMILLLAAAAIYVISQHKKILQHIVERKENVITAFAGIGIIAFAKLLDSSSRILPFTADYKTLHEIKFMYVEETLELLAAILFVYAAALSLKKAQTPDEDKQPETSKETLTTLTSKN